MGGNLRLNRLVNPYRAGMLGVAFKADREVVTAIFQLCSGLLILHVSSTPRCYEQTTAHWKMQ